MKSLKPTVKQGLPIRREDAFLSFVNTCQISYSFYAATEGLGLTASTPSCVSLLSREHVAACACAVHKHGGHILNIVVPIPSLKSVRDSFIHHVHTRTHTHTHSHFHTHIHIHKHTHTHTCTHTNRYRSNAWQGRVARKGEGGRREDER